MKLKQIFFYIITLFSILTMNSCGSVSKSYAKEEFTEEFKAIPPDFGSKNTILLITLRQKSSYDYYLKEAAQLYKGEYVFIGLGEEILPEYSDKEKFRFVFDYSDGSRSKELIAKRFFVKDRVEDKIYQCGYETAFFGKALKAYMENLELKRISKNK
jgi:hypothetical protein